MNKSFACLIAISVVLIAHKPIAPAQMIDTTKFYLILIDALVNGYSSSPSNSTKQPKLRHYQKVNNAIHDFLLTAD